MFFLNFNSNDPNKPSFFEMWAQHQFITSMKPAMRYLLSVLALRLPRVNVLVTNIDELFHGLQLVVEHFYLTNYQASFSENFYSLRRREGGEVAEGAGGLSRKHVWWTIFFLVVMPYVKGKLDAWFKRNRPAMAQGAFGLLAGNALSPAAQFPAAFPLDMGDEEDAEAEEGGGGAAAGAAAEGRRRRSLSNLTGSALSRVGGVAQGAALLLYPYFHATYEGASLVYQLLYMHDYTDYYTWFHHLQGVVIKRMTLNELVTMEQALAAKREKFLSKWRGRSIYIVVRVLYRVWNFLFDYSPYVLPFLVFLFRFAEWWYAEQAEIEQQQAPIPPPPRAVVAAGGLKLLEDRTLCPLCRETRKNAALLAVSGYAFCYRCIFEYVTEHGKCPVTLVAATEEDIRKLYTTA